MNFFLWRSIACLNYRTIREEEREASFPMCASFYFVYNLLYAISYFYETPTICSFPIFKVGEVIFKILHQLGMQSPILDYLVKMEWEGETICFGQLPRAACLSVVSIWSGQGATAKFAYSLHFNKYSKCFRIHYSSFEIL